MNIQKYFNKKKGFPFKIDGGYKIPRFNLNMNYKLLKTGKNF